MNWAGLPTHIVCDRGTHNRGVLKQQLEQRGCRFRFAALEAPYQLGKIERGGGILKGMMKRVIASTTTVGEDELRMCLVECLETKNRQGTVNGFSPCQWVLGRNPRMFGWQDEVDDDFHNVLDPDPTSTFNRRGAMRESARLACAMEDSHRRVRAALLRRGGTPEEIYRPGDLIAFKRKQKTGGWIGPARVLATEGKNLWILHTGGIPVLVAGNRVRAANAEEHLENELLDKSRLSRKRPFLDPEAVQGQQPMWTMRGSTGGDQSGVDRSGGESPKRVRSSDEGAHSPARSSPLPSAAASPAAPARSGDLDELLHAEVEESGGPAMLEQLFLQ